MIIKEGHLENRDNLFKQYKKDCPQTVGETDSACDNDNFIDWLVSKSADLQSQLTLSEAKVKLNYTTAIDLENELAEKNKEIIDLKAQLVAYQLRSRANYGLYD